MLPLSTVVTFGKYKGKSLENLVNDRSYVNWVLDNLTTSKCVSKELMDTIKYTYDNLPDNPITGGTLTDRTKSLLENRSYTIILRKSFHFLRKSFYFYIKLSN